jgi:RNA polymerase sigma-70 factor (ECF subfamily)
MSPVKATLFIAALYKAHAAAVLAKLRRLGIEESALHDLLQDVFVVAWRRQAKIPKDAAGARRWLFDSARKHAANFHRLHRHKYEEFNPDAIEAAVAEPEDPEAHAELANLVWSALREFACEDAELLWRHEVVGESLTELAAWLGLTKSGAHVRLERAKERLRVQAARLEQVVELRGDKKPEVIKAQPVDGSAIDSSYRVLRRLRLRCPVRGSGLVSLATRRWHGPR